MNKQNIPEAGQELYRVKLRELVAKSGLSNKYIAEQAGVSEKTIGRVLSGEAKNPSLFLVRKIINICGGSLKEIFEESDAVIGNQDLVALEAIVQNLKEENLLLTNSLNDATLNVAMLKERVNELENENNELKNENKLLKIQLEYEKKIVDVHNYYNKLTANKDADK